MHYQLSDEDSSDSESGIRFKTTNTRDKFDTPYKKKSSERTNSDRDNSRYRPETSNYSKYRDHYRSSSSDRRRNDKYSRRSKDKHERHRRSKETPERDKSYSRKTANYSYTKSHKRDTSRREYSESDSDNEQLEKRDRSKSDYFGSKSSTQSPTKKSKSKHESSNLSTRENSENDSDSFESKAILLSESKNESPEKQSAFELYGPQLPMTSSKTKNNICNSENNSDSDFGPKLPENLNNFGPALPSHLKRTNDEQNNSNSLSPKKQKSDEEDIINSVSPSSTISKEKNQGSVKNSQKIGPTLPEHLRAILLKIPNHVVPVESDSEDDVIGPLPFTKSSGSSHAQLEERALEIKLGLLNKPDNDVIVREEWMLELPEVRSATLGLGPRKFRAKEMPDMSDRSSWTDTPKVKANTNPNTTKSDLKTTAELERIKERDSVQEKIVEKQKKKKRDKSLIDLHQEKLKKDKQKEENSNAKERRPFSRDVDLKVNRFDDAQTKAIIKKAQLLDTKFSSGQSKFL